MCIYIHIYIYRKNGCEYPFRIGGNGMNKNKNPKQTANDSNTKMSQPAYPLWLVDWSAGWLLTAQAHLSLYVMIWKQNLTQTKKSLYKPYPNIKNKPQISTCLMFGTIQEKLLETMEINQKNKRINLVQKIVTRHQ